MLYVYALQSGEDVRFIRKILDSAGGAHVRIISKVENEAGMRNIDEIIQVGKATVVLLANYPDQLLLMALSASDFCELC